MSSTRTPRKTKTKARKGAVPAKPVVAVDLEADTATADPALEAAPIVPAKPLSGLDAAAQVLRDVGQPMNAPDLVARILERGLWTSAGKTPASTIYAAMHREIRAKGLASRFQKVDRGRFAAAR